MLKIKRIVLFFPNYINLRKIQEKETLVRKKQLIKCYYNNKSEEKDEMKERKIRKTLKSNIFLLYNFFKCKKKNA